jgi:hypothetical protein
MLGSADEAEDLVQETYLRAWRSYGTFEGRSSLRVWLYRIATNTCLTALQHRGRRALPSGLGGPGDDPDAPPDPADPDVASSSAAAPTWSPSSAFHPIEDGQGPVPLPQRVGYGCGFSGGMSSNSFLPRPERLLVQGLDPDDLVDRAVEDIAPADGGQFG